MQFPTQALQRRPASPPDSEFGRSASTVQSALRGASIFHGVSSHAVHAILDDLQPRFVAAGAKIYGQGDLDSDLYIVVSGKIKVLHRTAGGRSILFRLAGPNDVLGVISALDPAPRASSAIAVTDVRVAALPQPALQKHIAQCPEFCERLFAVLAREIRYRNMMSVDVCLGDVRGRLAKKLLHLADTFGSPGPEGIRVEHNLTQTELGQLAATTREGVNKTLMAFAARGWIRVEDKAICILDAGALGRRAS